MGGGAQLRMRLPLFFGAEASVDYRHSEFDTTKIHDWPVQLSGLIYLPHLLMVQPFLLAGVGWYHTTVETPNSSNTDTRFGPHAGAGVEWNLNARWFLDATYRYVWVDKFHSDDPNAVQQDFKDRGHMITAGINVRL